MVSDAKATILPVANELSFVPAPTVELLEAVGEYTYCSDEVYPCNAALVLAMNVLVVVFSCVTVLHAEFPEKQRPEAWVPAEVMQ